MFSKIAFSAKNVLFRSKFRVNSVKICRITPFFIDLRKGNLKVALSRQKARNCLINDSTRNTLIFMEKGKESFQKGKTLFNLTNSQSILPIQIFYFPLHGLLNTVELLKILWTFNIWTMHGETSSDAEILHDLTSCCRNSARCNVKCCRNSARCNVKCCRNSARSNVKCYRNSARFNVKCCNTSWHWKKLMFTLGSQLFITIRFNNNLRVNLDCWAKPVIRFTSDKSKQQPFVELT